MNEKINDPKSRRNFFKRGLNKAANMGVTAAEQKAKKKAKHWIRPPFACDELDFLLACTRCNACIDACPKNVIFPLSAKRGVEVAGTPALDILNKGCHLCTDWPCVSACKDKALSFESLGALEQSPNEALSLDSGEAQEGELKTHTPKAEDCPPFAKAHIEKSHCLPWQGPECGACRNTCPIPNTLIWDGEKPEIVTENCVGCGLCREACIATPNAISIRPLP